VAGEKGDGLQGRFTERRHDQIALKEGSKYTEVSER
jgi:hypothetical protein